MNANNIKVKTLLEALSRPSTLAALIRKTGYPVGQVISLIHEARAAGNPIQAVGRPGQPTYYERKFDAEQS